MTKRDAATLILTLCLVGCSSLLPDGDAVRLLTGPPGGWGDDDYRPRRYGPSLQSGGDRPTIAAIQPRTISFPSSFPVGGIVIPFVGIKAIDLLLVLTRLV